MIKESGDVIGLTYGVLGDEKSVNNTTRPGELPINTRSLIGPGDANAVSLMTGSY